MVNGPALVIWAANGIEAAWQKSKSLFVKSNVPNVVLHCWPGPGALKVARELKAINPGVNIWFGCGVDGIARRLVNGSQNEEACIREMLTIARGVKLAGALGLYWNAEAAYKANGEDRKKIESMVKKGLAKVKELYPDVRQLHTAYDGPSHVNGWGGHGDYCWSAWLGDESPVEFSIPQVYWAAGGPKGIARYNLHKLSWKTAQDNGRISKNMPTMPFLQIHGCDGADIVRVALESNGCFLWASPSRTDDKGKEAVCVLAWMFRSGLWSKEAIKQFQASNALTADGVVGPLTYAALVQKSQQP